MSKLLKRALKISIWPAVLMIAAKLLGIVGVSMLYDLNFLIDNNVQGIYSVQLYFTDSSNTLFVNSISNIFMLLVLGIPTFYYIIKTSVYQSTLQNPRTIVKITRLDVLKWITKKDTSFLQIFIWSSFLTIVSGINIVHALQSSAYMWTGIVAGVIALLNIWGAIKTFELEIDNIYPRDRKYY